MIRSMLRGAWHRGRSRLRYVRARIPIRIAHWFRLFDFVTGARTAGSLQERLTVILLQYKRPFNLDPILSSVLLCSFVDEVIVSINDPDFPVQSSSLMRDPRVRLLRHERRRFACIRSELALDARNEWILAIDDDVFPTPEQIRSLFEALVSDPSVPHGFGGDLFEIAADGRCRHRLISTVEGIVDSLIWAFAFTRSHTRRYFELLDLMNISNEDMTLSEDVPLSFSGSGLSRIHAFGTLQQCPTRNKPGIATWKNDGFLPHRTDLVKQMRRITGFPPAVPIASGASTSQVSRL